MKRFSEQFNKKASDIRLNATEKRELKERVFSYMEYHPLPASLKEAGSAVSVSGQEFILFNFNKWRAVRWSASFAFVFLISVSYLAERAIPGDTLYSVKVSFNEEVRGTLARSPYEKVVWETELLNRRIAEARLLADEGKLTPEAEVIVASAVKIHSDNARKEIENLKLSDKDEATLASIGLNTALDIQTASLKQREQTEGEGKSTNRIAAVLSANQAAEPATADSDLPAYERLLAKVESETTRAYELVQGIKASATNSEKNDVTNRLGDIEDRIEAAMNLSAVDELTAKKDLVLALQQIQRLVAFMTNIDVRANFTVDDLVPDTLTEEQRFVLVRKEVENTEAILKSVLAKLDEGISTGTTTSTSAPVTIMLPADQREKVTLGIKQAEASLVAAKEMLTDQNTKISAVEQTSSEAYNIISDIAALLEDKKPLIGDIVPPVIKASSTKEVVEEIEV